MNVKIGIMPDREANMDYRLFIDCVFTVDDVKTPDELATLNWSQSLAIEQYQMEKAIEAALEIAVEQYKMIV